MPPKKKCGKSKFESHYKPKKRKAISPIQIASEQSERKSEAGINQQNSIGQSSKQLGSCVSTDTSPQNQNKRFHQSSPEYFNFGQYFTTNLDALTNMSMNFPQMPFGSQYMQSPPFNSQFTASNTAPGPPPPPWATEIIDDIKSIKLSVSKIDNIEKLVNKINSKVENLETKVKTMDTKVTDIEKSNQFINNEFEETKQKLKSADKELKRLNSKCKDFDDVVTKLQTQNQNLETKANDLEFRGLRENLLFHGLQETQNEDCEAMIKQFIAEKLEITKEISIDRAHRLGRPTNRTRPIVVKFHSYKDRELIRTTAMEKVTELKASNQGVGVQQTKAVLQKRRDLNAVYEREKAAGNTLKWAGAKLLVRDRDGGNFREVTE